MLLPWQWWGGATGQLIELRYAGDKAEKVSRHRANCLLKR